MTNPLLTPHPFSYYLSALLYRKPFGKSCVCLPPLGPPLVLCRNTPDTFPSHPSTWNSGQLPGDLMLLALCSCSWSSADWTHQQHSTQLISISLLKRSTFFTGLLGYYCLLSPFTSPAIPTQSCPQMLPLCVLGHVLQAYSLLVQSCDFGYYL